MNKRDLKSDTYSVYALTDPRDGSLRYIGISKNTAKRFLQHVQRAYSPSLKDTWIRDLLGQGLFPGLTILETVQNQNAAREREKYWVETSSQNRPLLNLSLNTKYHDGGTRIDDPALAEHTYQQIMRERAR